jgi:hypothetical protein
MHQFYKCLCNWDGKQYCGLTIKWDHNGQKVHLLMPNYVNKSLARFQHTPPHKRQDQPYPHIKPTYGAKKQYSQVEDDSPTLNKAGKKFIQEVCGVFLYLAWAVDRGLLPTLSSLASQEANPTEKTMELCKQFLDYMATQEDTILTYRASDMILAMHSNASYLSEPKSCNHVGGHMLMAEKDDIPFNNGAVLNILQIIWAVMSSVVEAELGALFINAKIAVSMHQMLTELGQPQPPTPIQTDSATAHTLLTNKILPKAPKAIDMRFHWLRCCNAQGQFCYYWGPGTQNLGDYFTKHHPTSHHKSVHPAIITPTNDPEYTKLFKTTTTPVIFEPQIKTMVSTKSFVKNLL